MDGFQRICSPIKCNSLVEKGLDLHLKSKRAKHCLKWGTINIAILGIFLFDISNKCPYAFSNWYYVEYVATAIVTFSVLCYFSKYFYYLFSSEQVTGTLEQKNLLRFDSNDKSFVTNTPTKASIPDTSSAHGINATILSWHSSFNDSSRVMGNPNWSYQANTPPRHSISPGRNASWNSSLNASTLSSNASFMSPYKKFSKDEVITDERGLQNYLKEVSKQEREPTSDTFPGQITFHTGSINSFWNYCNTAANLLKTSLYQLSPSNATSSPNQQLNKDESGYNRDMDGHSEVIKKISSAKLSKYVANLRMWISITILQRLETEINKTDAAFKSRGFSDLKIGNVGLERLKKTAENQNFVNMHVPMLPLIVPFLEMSTNQEYLVQRIKDMGKGSCIANYHWNSGVSYLGLKWDEHLPTDSAILFHLFCTYLDSQLMPLPQPGGRPFYSRYVIIGDKKTPKEILAEVKNKSGCAILFTNQLKPKFNFISDDIIHNCAHDRNNLFYVIIQFLIYMKNHHEGLLEGVNLGKSGINIICIIED